MNFNSNQVAFNDAYKKLNLAQREAINTIEGPVMVIAGPGTGKTQILTLRIANILLKTDTAPGSILALTFTESGAKAMRDRLRQYIGSTAYQIPIYTFHGFAQKLISDYPDAYERVIGGRLINDLEKIANIENIINGESIKLLRPFGNPTYYVGHILRIISQLKQEYVTPDRLGEIITFAEGQLLQIEKIHQKGAHKGKVRGEYANKEKSLNKNRELLYIYRQYEALLQEQNFYDFEDMMVETIKALSSDEGMLRDLQENYQYILADEHQDVNGSQNKILDLLSSFHDNPNIFVVGDEKQAIYRFQGASLENFLYFTRHYPKAKTISLTENYRSGQAILDAAYSLMRVESGPLSELRLPLSAAAVAQSNVTRREFSHQVIEDRWIGEEVKRKIDSGISQNEIAVIVRTNREVESITSLLRKQGIAVTASADGDILRHPIMAAVQILLEAVVIRDNQAALFSLLHAPYLEINTNDLFKVLSAQSYERTLWQIITEDEYLQEIDVSNKEPFRKVAALIEGARQLEVHAAPHRVLEYILQTSGLLQHLVKYDPLEGVRVVRRLYDEVESLVVHDGVDSLRAVMVALVARINYSLPLNAPYVATETESVQVMTAHKSKGLEFKVVFIPHLTDSNWGGSVKKQYFDINLKTEAGLYHEDEIEDERRLLYVAMTRAKDELFLSSSDTDSAGRELSVTRLLTLVNEELITVVDTKINDKNFNLLPDLMNQIKTVEFDKSFLLKMLTDRGFSATSLNNYLRSPWDYFYRNVLRIPETQAPAMQFGTAIHNTLEYATRLHTQKGELPTLTVVKKRLEQELGKLPLNTEEYTRLQQKGLEALVVYLEHLKTCLPKQTKEEMKIRVLLPTGLSELPEVLLTGKLDRLDLDENGKAIAVVDYKTGKAKSRKVIEGETKDADGGYKRQLVFYALLLSLYNDERYVCRRGVLSFVEPTSKGEIKEESFLISDQEIEDLKQDIIRSVKEIIAGEFLSMPCDGETSSYCHLVEQFKKVK